MTDGWWRAGDAGVTVRIRVQPRARRNGVLGVVAGADGPRLRVAVAAAPEAGRANRAVCEALAGALGVAPSAVEVAQGMTSREKLVRVAGEPAALAHRLEALA